MALTPQRGSSSGLSRPELWLLLWAAAWRLGATACPALCTCTGTTVDCHGTGLQAIPKNIPRNTERLELNGNNITRIHKNDFAGLKQLRVLQLMENQIGAVERGAFDDMKELERLRLNRNQLQVLPELLFQNNQALSRLDLSENFLQGLRSLNSLVLYGNKITDLPRGVFGGLYTLQLLLLNANKINCIRPDAFQDLQNLSLLSLYDNKIQSLAKGTFTSLRAIQTLHLAQNPFICDCNLKWLADFLRTNPIETTGARCASPRRLANKRIGQIKSKKFRCSAKEQYFIPGTEDYHLNSECTSDVACPLVLSLLQSLGSHTHCKC